MGDLLNNLQQSMGNMPVWVLIIPVIMVLYFIGYLFYAKNSRNKKQAYMEQNPTHSCVYCELAQKGIKSVQVSIHSIDGSAQTVWFNEGMRIAYMLAPGNHVIETTAETSRPGVMHKNVRTTYGPMKMEVEVKESRKYKIGFDVKAEEFTFTEI